MHLPPAVLALGTIVSLPLLLIGGYIWQAGLDLHSPSSVRGWIELCARGREDVFCKAANADMIMPPMRHLSLQLHPLSLFYLFS